MLLNEHLIPQGDSFQTRYLPLFWTHFGGPSGSNLGSLTGISCIFGHHYLERIEFSYNTPQTSSETSLGRGILANWPKRLRFSIDGPRGERIVAIETFYERSIHLSFTDSSMNTIQSPYLCAFRVRMQFYHHCSTDIWLTVISNYRPLPIGTEPVSSLTNGIQRTVCGSMRFARRVIRPLPVCIRHK